MDSIYFAGIAEVVGKTRTKEISFREIVDAHLERVDKLQPKLNAFVHIDAEGARRQALAAEASVLHGDEVGALHGVGLSIKSCIDVAGWPCPAGSRLRADYVAGEDAVLVSRLRAAGAILIGNTDVPEFLMAYETDNALSGRTSNPWELSLIGGRIERGRSGGDCVGLFDGRSGKRWRRIGAGASSFLWDQRVKADSRTDSWDGTFSARGCGVLLVRRGGTDGSNGGGCAHVV